jgi:hypothetical protein
VFEKRKDVTPPFQRGQGGFWDDFLKLLRQGQEKPFAPYLPQAYLPSADRILRLCENNSLPTEDRQLKVPFFNYSSE